MSDRLLRTRSPFVYLERQSLKVESGAVVTEEGNIPIAGLSAIILGPGTTVSHRTMAELTKTSTSVLWTGEEGVLLYSAGKPLTENPERLLAQVKAHTYRRDRVARAMFEHRFGKVGASTTIDQLRGMEGARVKGVYADLAKKHGVVWNGRNKNERDSINAAINAANSHLYALGTVAVMTAGYSPSIGFIHSGFERAFVCDIIDLVKFETSVAVAFEVWAKHQHEDWRKVIRHTMRDLAKKESLIDKLINLSIDMVGA